MCVCVCVCVCVLCVCRDMLVRVRACVRACVWVTFSFIHHNEYSTIIEHVSTSVPIMDNMYTNIHVQVMDTQYTKSYRHIDSHSDREWDKVPHR